MTTLKICIMLLLPIMIYAQALHIDWVVFQNCPINVKILQNFLGTFKTAQSMYGNYPINVKCLRTPPVQAFHIDWVVFKFLAIFWHFLKNYPINVKCLHRGGAQAFHID